MLLMPVPPLVFAGLCVPSHGVPASPASPRQELGQLEHSTAGAGKESIAVLDA